MILSDYEKDQIKYLLPMQGNFELLEMVEGIFLKVKEANEEKEVQFSDSEIGLLKETVSILDQNNKLSFTSLSLIRKIMEEKI